MLTILELTLSSFLVFSNITRMFICGILILYVGSLLIIFKKHKIPFFRFPKIRFECRFLSFWSIFVITSCIFIILLIGSLRRELLISDYRDFKNIEISNYQKIEITCYEYSKKNPYPFQPGKIQIINIDRIEEYHEILSDRCIFNGNHPQTLWHVKLLFFEKTSDVHVFDISKTDNTGIKINYFGIQDNDQNTSITFRNDNIEDLIIEDFSKTIN